MAVWLYNGLLIVASPLWGVWLAWRLIGQRKERRGFGQRWRGLDPAALPPAARHPRIWIHAVSVGEVMAVAPVVRALRRQWPDALLVGSTVTDLGQEAMKAAVPELDLVCYLPFDLPWSVRRTIRSIAPTLFLFAETELWPNVLLFLEQAGVPAIMVNGHVSERSVRRYRWVGPFIRRVVGTVDALTVQSDTDRERFVRLGADPSRVTVCGNLKADSATAAAPDPQPLRRLLGLETELLIVAGSTHHPEEAAIGRAFLGLLADRSSTASPVRLCVAPRHRDRCPSVAAQLRQLGLMVQRRSELPAGGRRWANPREVVLLDTVGELVTAYRLATVTIMGGTLAPIGGHNVLEPAAAGCPIVVGPHTGQWEAAAAGLAVAGGALTLGSDAEIEPALRALLDDPERRAGMGAAARDYVLGQQGATARAMAVIDRFISDAGAAAGRRTSPRAMAARWLNASEGAGAWVKALLRPVAWCYGWAMAARRGAYRRGWLAAVRLPVCVVSVGNLTIGGSGKTPMTIALAQRLQAAGGSVGVVLRGYGGRYRTDALLVSDGRVVTAESRQAGDEAVLLARRLSGVPIAVGRVRADAIRLLLERRAPRIVLVDDGFQHLSLVRDVNLLIIDAGQPILEGELLPCGPLREQWSAVRDASAIVLVDRAGGARDETMREALRPRLRRWGFSGPLFSAPMQPSGVVPRASGDEQPLRVLSGARVSICSGIGQPGAFREMVTLAGATVCDEWVFGDHHDYTREEWEAIAARARQRGAGMIVTTEKDLVKLADWPAAGPPVVALRIAVNVEPEREWHDWLTAQRLLPGDPPEPNGAAGAGRSNRPADLLCGAPRPGGG